MQSRYDNQTAGSCTWTGYCIWTRTSKLLGLLLAIGLGLLQTSWSSQGTPEQLLQTRESVIDDAGQLSLIRNLAESTCEQREDVRHTTIMRSHAEHFDLSFLLS